MCRVWKMQSEHEEIKFEQILQEGLWYENILFKTKSFINFPSRS